MFPSKNYSFRTFLQQFGPESEHNAKIAHLQQPVSFQFSVRAGTCLLAERHYDNHGLNCHQCNFHLHPQPLRQLCAKSLVLFPNIKTFMDGYVLSTARNINFIHANKNEKRKAESFSSQAAIFAKSRWPRPMQILRVCPESVSQIST